MPSLDELMTPENRARLLRRLAEMAEAETSETPDNEPEQP